MDLLDSRMDLNHRDRSNSFLDSLKNISAPIEYVRLLTDSIMQFENLLKKTSLIDKFELKSHTLIWPRIWIIPWFL